MTQRFNLELSVTMKIISHPSSQLKPEWITTIRGDAPLAEQHGSLTQNQLELIYQQAWFKLFVPKEYSGLEASLPESLRLEEALSWADGSLGWTVTLCSGAGWFGGFMDVNWAKEIFKKNKVCLGGSGAPGGIAIITNKGYQISGQWKYATGADHLTHFTANCIVKDGDTILSHESGEPVIMPFVFTKDEVTITKDWNTIGLIATASYSFEVKALDVPVYRSFKISPEALQVGQPIYKYPFLQFAEATLAANISGMAVHFTDSCEEIFGKRIASNRLIKSQQKLLTKTLYSTKNKLEKSRVDFYTVIDKSWENFLEDNVVTEEVLTEISLKSRALAARAHKIVDKLYPLCGLAAANPASEINRVWRDIHTASQHSLLTLA